MKSFSGAKTLPTTSEWKVARILAFSGVLLTLLAAIGAHGAFSSPRLQWWLAGAWVVLWMRFLWGSWQLLRVLKEPTSPIGWGLTTAMALALFGGLVAVVWSGSLWWVAYVLLALSYGCALVRYSHEEKRGAMAQRAFTGKRRLDWLGFVGILLLGCVAYIVAEKGTLWTVVFISMQFLGAIVIGLRTGDPKVRS